MRKLATIQQIAEIKPIVGADAIEAVRVNGWWVVTKKNEYTVGDLVVFLEVDSWVPHSLAPFLTKPGQFPKEYNGVPGQRLRTIKLRGQLSQGLVLPLSVFPHSLGFDHATERTVGEDVSVWLNIQKWERPESAQLGGQARGSFPSWMRKTDQERIQNCFNDIPRWEYVIEEKLEGSSMSVGVLDGEVHICSRNQDLKWESEEDRRNTFVKVAIESGIVEALQALGEDIALSGELIGPGIQGNIYKLNKPEWRIFDILDVRTGKYLGLLEREAMLRELGILWAPLDRAPILGTVNIQNQTLDEMLTMAEGKSMLLNTQEREGLVFKSVDNPDYSFKVISNKYLLQEKND